MTAILKDLRSLKAARDRGEITQEQFARAEAMLHDLIEDAVVDAPAPEVQPPAEPPRRRATDRPAATPARIWETGLMVVAGLASLTMLVAVLVGSMTLALTLLVTVIAAISVRAVKMLDD